MDLGSATVERIGSIEFDKTKQRFWVKILRGFPQPEPLRAEHLRAEGLDPENFLIDGVAEDGRLLFRRYAHAVSVEQAIVAMLLVRGALW